MKKILTIGKSFGQLKLIKKNDSAYQYNIAMECLGGAVVANAAD